MEYRSVNIRSKSYQLLKDLNYCFKMIFTPTLLRSIPCADRVVVLPYEILFTLNIIHRQKDGAFWCVFILNIELKFTQALHIR